MGQIIVDAMLHEKLPSISQPVELIDGNGKTMGWFYPDAAVDVYVEPTDEELQRLEQLAKLPGPRYSTAQVLAHLERLGADRN